MRAVCLALGASVWLVAWAGQGGPPAARASGSAAAAIRLAKKQSAEEKKREQAKSQSLPPNLSVCSPRQCGHWMWKRRRIGDSLAALLTWQLPAFFGVEPLIDFG